MSIKADNSFGFDFDKMPRGPLAALEYGDTTAGGAPLEQGKSPTSTQYSFPSNLGAELDHWVCFRVSRSHKFRENTQEKSNTRCFIYLPIPQNLATGYNAGYQQMDLGTVGGFTNEENTGDYEVTTGDAAKQAFAQIGVNLGAEAVGAVLGTVAGGAKAGAITGAVASDSVLGAAQGAIMGNLGLALNPHKAMLFQGVNFRTHSFQYNFIPKNVHESKTLLQIVGAFKYFMTPGMTNGGKGFTGAFLNYPEQFDIDFHYGRNLFDIGQSVLTQFDVNYHGQGVPLYHDVDGEKYPAAVNMSMSFTEVTTLTKKQLAEKNR